jgi:hypothetical protein
MEEGPKLAPRVPAPNSDLASIIIIFLSFMLKILFLGITYFNLSFFAFLPKMAIISVQFLCQHPLPQNQYDIVRT